MKRWTAPTVVGLAAFVLAATASAASFSGRASSDPQAKVSFEVSGTTKNGKFVNGRVSEIDVDNQKFVCYTKSGQPVERGRVDYPWFGIEPATIKPNGSFRGEFKFRTRGYTIEQFVFKGRIVRGRNGKFKASGTYQAKVSEGGIEFGFCGDKNAVAWEARVGG